MPIRIRLSRSLHPLPVSSPFAHIPTRPDIPAVRSTKPGLAKRNNPIYRIIAQHSEKRRDATGLETLGIYDPVPRPLSQLKRATAMHGSKRSPTSTTSPELILEPPEMESHVTRRGRTVERERMDKFIMWDADRLRYWLGVGGEPTATVVTLLCKGGILDHSNPQESLRAIRQAYAKAHGIGYKTGTGEGTPNNLLPPSAGPGAFSTTQPLATVANVSSATNTSH